MISYIELPISAEMLYGVFISQAFILGGWLLSVHVKLNQLMDWKTRSEGKDKEYKDLDKRLTMLETDQKHILATLHRIEEKLEKLS